MDEGTGNRNLSCFVKMCGEKSLPGTPKYDGRKKSEPDSTGTVARPCVCPVRVPAPPGVFLPVLLSAALHSTVL